MLLRPLILTGVLLLIVVVPFSQGGWGEELPWIKLISAIVGPTTVFYLYWHYWRDTASEDASHQRRRELVLIAAPPAAAVGVLLAGATTVGAALAAAGVGLVLGCAY